MKTFGIFLIVIGAICVVLSSLGLMSKPLENQGALRSLFGGLFFCIIGFVVYLKNKK